MEVSIQSPMPWFGRLVIGLRSSGFSVMYVRVGFLVDKVTLGQGSLTALLVSHIGIILLLLITYLRINIILIRRSNGPSLGPF